MQAADVPWQDVRDRQGFRRAVPRRLRVPAGHLQQAHRAQAHRARQQRRGELQGKRSFL